jgi:hypothetical protein
MSMATTGGTLAAPSNAPLLQPLPAIFVGSRICCVWVLWLRITLWRGDDPNLKDTDGAMALAWFVWERDPRGPVVAFVP